MFVVMFAVLALALGGCGDDSDSSGSGSGSSGGDGDGDGITGDGDGVMMTAIECTADDWWCEDYRTAWEADHPDGCSSDGTCEWFDYERNLDCPAVVPPDDSNGAARGQCCHRGKPNSVALALFDDRDDAGELLPGELSIVAYRLNYSATTNHPATVGAAPLPDIGIASKDAMENVLIFRFASPRSGGEQISGETWSEIGGAAYQCDDGTFTFYGDKAAPIIEGGLFPNAENADRYEMHRTPGTVDVDVDVYADRATTLFADVYSHGPSNSPSFDAAFSEYTWDYDLISMGFEIIQFGGPEEDDDDYSHVDCRGNRDAEVWAPHTTNLYVSYIPLAENNTPDNGIVGIQETSLTTLFAFGLLADAMDIANLNVDSIARCEPETAGCRWLKLPDSLCPDTDEQDLWVCHIGISDNPSEFEGDEVRCVEDYTVPDVYDQDQVITGQCCDPMGESDSLPACNAWRTLNDMVAASAEINSDPDGTPHRTNDLFRSCL